MAQLTTIEASNQSNRREQRNQLDVFAKLPLELRLGICEYLCDHCTNAISLRSTSKPDYGPLACLCLTSRSFRAAAQQVLCHFFWCQDGDPGRRLGPFLTTLSRRPELMAHVRRIRYQPDPWDDAPLDFQTDDTSADENLVPLRVEIFRLHRSLFDEVLSQAGNLEELTIQIEEGWRLPPIDFSCLRHLNLGRPGRNSANYDDGPTPNYPQDKRGLRTAPRLEQLWLDQWNISEVAGPKPLCLASNIRLLTMAPESQDSNEISNANKVTPVTEASKLATFEFIENFETRQGGEKILPLLLEQKYHLTSISIQSWRYQVDLALLGEFIHLKHLRLHTWPQSTASTEGEVISYPSVLPRSLESLHLCFWNSSHQEGIITWLSQSLSEYKHLKYVRTTDFNSGRSGHTFRQRGVYKNFVEAGVEFVMVEWRTPGMFNGFWDSV
ncbi:hypothetical protein BKA56DRAFT_625782 [Ilyonectria sp. MPI-CAGE-AT-0026]|nr:hypothetical protein BKA56DRAFT_625782 [Ilyonectria sp. MPI-CAGE-AT-0026]